MEIGKLHFGRVFGLVHGLGHGGEIEGAVIDDCCESQEVFDGGEVEGEREGGQGS